MRRLAISLTVAIALPALGAGCAATVHPRDAMLRDDRALPYLEFSSGRMAASVEPERADIELVRRRDRKSGQTSTLLIVEIGYADEQLRHYDRVRNASAELLRVQPVAQRKNCGKGKCLCDETISVEIPEKVLSEVAPAGYAVKIFARAGREMLLTIPRDEFTELVAASDKYGVYGENGGGSHVFPLIPTPRPSI